MEKSNVNINLIANRMPSGFTYIGVVKTDNCPIASALVKNVNTGLYALLNAGILQSVNQDLVKNYLGGAK